MNEELTTLIEAFLAEPRQSKRGGYAEFTQDDIVNLRQVIVKLFELKFEPDPDGDRPLEVIIWDKSASRMPYFKAIPHQDSDMSFNIAVSNLSVALSDMRLEIDLKRLREKEEKKQ